jgi:hypothetical protein
VGLGGRRPKVTVTTFDFTASDGSAWPSPWQQTNATITIQGNRARRTKNPIAWNGGQRRRRARRGCGAGQARQGRLEGAVEEEESTGGVKDNVKNEWDESQEH